MATRTKTVITCDYCEEEIHKIDGDLHNKEDYVWISGDELDIYHTLTDDYSFSCTLHSGLQFHTKCFLEWLKNCLCGE